MSIINFRAYANPRFHADADPGPHARTGAYP